MEVFKDRPATVNGIAERFTGNVNLEMLKKATETNALQIGHVHFTPGAHTAWHSHPFGQTLIVTDGQGWVCSRGGQKFEIRAGDVVVIEPGEEHWHGATDTTSMSHYAINAADADGNSAYWGEHVHDGEYLA